MIASVLFTILGGVGLALSLYIPHKEGFTNDHAVGTGLAGVAWAGACVALAILAMTHAG